MFRENWISWNLKWFLKTWECQKRWKDIIVALDLQMIRTLLQLQMLLNFDVILSARQKGSPGSFCSWCCTLLELGCSSCSWDLCWRRGASCSWDAFLMNRALWIWSSILRWSPGCSCSALEVLNPGCDDDLLQKSSWDVQSFLAFPQEPKWV